MMNKKVYTEFNILKGLGIFFVILGHIDGQSNSIMHIIFSFHMPLFFFVSGFFYKISSVKDFFIKKGKRILVPYVLFSLITFLIYYIPNFKNSKFSFSDFFIGTFLGISNDYYLSWNIVLWFLPCLFVINLMYLLADKYKLYFLLVIFFLIGIYFKNDTSTILPFHLISVFLQLPFFVGGVLLKKYYGKLNEVLLKWSFVPLLIIGYLISFYNTKTPDIRLNIIGDFFYFYFGAFLLILGLLSISFFIHKSKPIIWLGENSLLIMCMHLKFLIISKWLLLKLNINTAFFVSVLICLLLYFPIVIIKKYLPVLEGK